MSQPTLYPVVMAGGSGSRLWPLSRVLYPKQFLCLKGDLTMLQTTVNRLNGVKCESPVVICNEQHRFIVAEQLRQLNKLTENIILEPAGRNTAPAIALAALAAQRNSPDSDPLMLVLAADHVIQNEEAFRDAVRAAMPYAESGKLVTFGIVPDLPETGYGYIRRGAVSQGQADAVAFEVAQFVEKPDLDTAQAYVASGEYYWNSGMFLFRAGRFLEELKNSVRIFCRPVLPQWTASIRISILSVWMKRRSWPARKSQSITQSWKKPPMPWWCRWTRAGAMSAPGRRCGKSAPIRRKATCITAM